MKEVKVNSSVSSYFHRSLNIKDLLDWFCKGLKHNACYLHFVRNILASFYMLKYIDIYAFDFLQ